MYFSYTFIFELNNSHSKNHFIRILVKSFIILHFLFYYVVFFLQKIEFRRVYLIIPHIAGEILVKNF